MPYNRIANHLAGIIPINSQPMDFKFPWPDCMQPIAANFLAIERSILECATAGCDTIWIVCPYEIQPLLRHRLGSMVQDPVSYSNAKYVKFKEMVKKQIPIYYIPAKVKDKDKKDSIVWNMLSGCLTVTDISAGMSRWLIPRKYYICFPNAVFPSQYVRKYRTAINKKRKFLISHKGKTILDGEYLSASLNHEDVLFLIKEFRNQATGMWDPASPNRGDTTFPSERLSIENRYSGRFLTVKDIFSKLPIENETITMNAFWYYDISSWDGLKKYLSSEESNYMKRPIKRLLLNSEYRGIANELDTEDDMEYIEHND